MPKEYEETDLNTTYYLVQKNIGSNWADKGRFSTKEEALNDLQNQVNEDVEKNNIFLFRVIKVEEIKLIKSKEKKPDNMLDVF